MKSSIKLLVVVDTNIFISGLVWGGKPRKILESWLKSKFTLLMSPYLVFEIVSTYKDFPNPEIDVEKLKLYLQTKTHKITPSKKINICRDEKDNQILDLCFAGTADYLITGDKDLLVIKKFGKTKITKPKEFLKIISG